MRDVSIEDSEIFERGFHLLEMMVRKRQVLFKPSTEYSICMLAAILDISHPDTRDN